MGYFNDNKVFSIIKTAYVSETERDLIARYHLGEYDALVNNVITRQTGYTSKKNIISFALNNTAPYPNFYIATNIPYFDLSTSDIITNKGIELVCYSIEQNSNGNITFNFRRSTSFASNDELAQYLQNIQIQYKLATSYTEQVIEGRPLNTLDQNGCNWLRQEWEKELNLWNGVTTYTTSTSTYYKEFNLKPNSYYTLNFNTTNGGRILYTIGSETESVQYGNKITFQTDSSGYVKLGLSYASYGTNTTYSNIMFNEGTEAKPYQEYRGTIVRSNEVPISFTTDNNPPTTYGDWEALGSVVVGSNTLYGWRRL